MPSTRRQPVTLDTLFRPRLFGVPQWSPDGRWLVFSLSEPVSRTGSAGTALWLLSADGREKVRLTRGQGSEGAPVSDLSPCWSPDGRRVAFVSNRSGTFQIWVIPPFGGEAAPVTTSNCGCGPLMMDGFFAGMDWSPDGKHLVFVAQLPERKNASDVRVVGIDPGEGYAGVRTRIHLWSIPLPAAAEVGSETASPWAKRLTRGNYHHGDPRWSPDGRWIAFVSNQSGDEEAVIWSLNKNYDLWRMPSGGGKAERLTSNPGPDVSPRWSPDGRRLAYLSCPRCGSHADVLHLCVLDLDSGRTRSLTPRLDYSVDRLTAQCWSANGRVLWFTAGVRTENHLLRASAQDAKGQDASRPGELLFSPSVSPVGRRLACIVQSERNAGEIQVRHLPSASVCFQSNWNGWVRDHRLGRTRLARWKSDGLAIEGVVVLPPGYRRGRRYPLIVLPHGGPHGRATRGLNLAWHWLAAHGYVLLSPNFRGSTGYGQAFIDADRGDFGGGDFRDLMRGIDHLIDRGIAHPERLGIFGASYGGFMTTWAVGQTRRFKAAVAVCPVTHLQSMFGTTDIKSWTCWELDGRPWENFQDYVRCSPITYAPRVKTPTLLLHGEGDRRVPISQSEEFHAALRACGVRTRFVRYPNEGHGIAQPGHVRDYLMRALDWLRRI
ncbi:MAG: S9 family peptidase [Planctomycetes bacterium]|nr:S9 family peptidase [Planctomycetota bacterium]